MKVRRLLRGNLAEDKFDKISMDKALGPENCIIILNLITPFRGIRPQVKFAKKISSPNISYLNNFKFSKDKNFLNILNNPNISYANKILKELEKNKIIFQDKKDNYYLYKISFKKKILVRNSR